ncbi:hypothetical protein O6H91_06G065000 [Diphasiastrum complanatum]|nr:hypothetical protein O6H91_06G065000 [Diphasiastrum complanatum]
MEMVLRNDDGTSAEDYKRRADFFTRINEIFVAQKNSEDRAVESDANPSSAAVVAKSPSKSADRNTEITVSGGKSVVDEMEEEVLTLEDLLMEHDDGTGAADYNRRAAIFGWSAEMVTARTQHSQRSINSLQLEERKFEDVLVLEEDNGRAASDYSRRAAIFGKNAELLVAASHKRAEKKRLGCL